MNKTLEKIGELGIVPVVKIEKAEDALPLGRALMDGDLPIAEITFRTSAAEESIKVLNKELPDLLIGAGTVLTIEQVKRAVSAGAQFIVSPGFNPKVVDYCVENNILITPGLNNPTQIEMALERGIEVVKFFPAEASGGLPLLESMSAPYSGIKFIPTGGINLNNLTSYLSNQKVHACGGSWMVKDNLISSGNFEEITRLTQEAVAVMLGFEFAHLGINEEDEAKALDSANLLSHLFYLPLKEGTSSLFAGPAFEVIKNRYLGEHGHIAIATNDIHRAITYLKMKGISILPETAKEKEGKLKAVYLNQEVSGFAIHLLQK
ncbi:2-dehydro-3-deoxyphosphogluconate aldolase [Candidatus Atribacteria bacterium RBG_19FT_COMBO_35_14]|uniref:2-dehydro-3-deoxyphosphogluconate aldolase n=1 Tax=Candidatus Sediminicultor quintus TaxID=1797291 RepID=A0A1F5AG31_9BACT|nr:MAG: 2-dehydro-3-deoxyphosphogluconate aldolase [Candidatus Atribacteria bacterium RBG_19FT_COMBO_35_14]